MMSAPLVVLAKRSPSGARSEPGKDWFLSPACARSTGGAQSPDLRFQFNDPILQPLDDRLDLPLRKSLVNVLLAIHVPRFDREQDRAFHLPAIVGISKFGEQFWIVVDHLRGAPEFDAL